MSSKLVGAIEVGTSKVVVLAGEILGKGRLEIIGKGETSSRGITKGHIMDFKRTSDCVHAAILSAEDSAGAKLDSVYISQTGAHLEGFFTEGTVTVSSADNVVTREDIQRVTQEAKNKQIKPDRIYIHHIRNPFMLDDRVVVDPIGMEGDKLRVGYWSITGEERRVSEQVGIINGIGLPVDDMIVSSLASSVMVLTDEDKRNGALMVDIGAGTTDFALYRNGYVVTTGVIPVGGDHITNDLSLGLRINRKHAEKLKIDCAKAIVDKADMEDRVWSVGDQAIGDRQISRKAIYKIVNSRLQELFEILAKHVEPHAEPEDLMAGAVITGGSSQILGVEELASKMLSLPVRTGSHPSWVGGDIASPEYSTALGLFHYALTAQDRDDKKQQEPKSLLRKILPF